jgi:hypothetical protein
MVSELRNVDMNGAILHLTDGRHCLIESSQQSVTNNWLQGDKLEISVAESPVFKIHCVDSNESAHAMIYEGEEQLLELPN